VGGANYIAPNQAWSLSFTVDVTPVVVAASDGISVPFSDFLYTLGGSNTGLTPSEIDFLDGAPVDNGMFTVFFDDNDFMAFTGPRMFSGTLANPTMLAGVFEDTIPPFSPFGIFADTSGFGVNSFVQELTGTIVTASAVPEPSSFFLLIGGGLALAALRRRRAA
jgi:hypothetical protein